MKGTVASEINFTPINHGFKSILGYPNAFNGGSYSVNLPNMVTYKVKMYYTQVSLSGFGGNCSEGNYTVDELAGTLNLTNVNWKC
jgi:hypothetical protein